MREVLYRIASEADRTVAALADRCENDGRIDPALIDAHQWSAFRLATIHADLLAAKECLSETEGKDALDRDLAHAFAADVCHTSLGALDQIQLALGAEAESLAEIRTSQAYRDMQREWAAPERLAELGNHIVESGGDFGQVEMDEDTAMAADIFRRFARETVAPLAGRIHRENLTVPEELLSPMREMGVFGLSIPEAYGGNAGEAHNTAMMIAVTEALSQASLAAAGSLITRPEILARALLAGGTEAQKQRWLPAIAAGDPLCAIAITEPDYGSDVASLSLRARKVDGGWVLDGAKTWCTFAGKAGLLMVVARTDPDPAKGHRGLSLLLVEKPSYDSHDFAYEQDAYEQHGGGTLQGSAIPTIGYRGMHSFDLAFENFFVSDANLIGEEAGLGKGFYLTMSGMTGGRIQTAGRALGVMRASILAAVEYARQRKVFGQPLADYQLTQVTLARMASRYAACRTLAYAVGRRLDEGGSGEEASVAKLICCRAAEHIARDALQTHGGMGYAEESPISRYWVDARVLSIFEGAEETLALKVIARGLLEKALVRSANA